MERFLALHDKHLSFEKIAAALSAEFGITVSKNACIGKARRLELHREKPRTTPASKPKALRSPPAEPPGQVPLLHLGNDDCHFPFGDHPTVRFCGLPKKPGSPYCAEHHAVAFVSPKQRWLI
ncbi:hypothetical protein CWO89_34385 [Bradyrhizobium sp. Leo170]|nr:hypothetical protein CWO89_34385 [Bradyrhizobium sp. Leo170]